MSWCGSSKIRFFGDLELPNNIFAKRITRKQDEVFLEDEIPIMVDYLKKHGTIWDMGLLLQFQTGLRVGELSALKRCDIGPNSIFVCRSEKKYKNSDGKWTFSVENYAKTESGNRELIISDSAIRTLTQIQALNPNGEYLFMHNGKRICGSSFNKCLRRKCKKLNLNHRSTHKIRKTYGTTLLDSNVDDSFVSEQMGHSDVSTTRKLYYYSNKNAKSKIKQINNAINF